jgi:hypothetical protein
MKYLNQIRKKLKIKTNNLNALRVKSTVLSLGFTIKIESNLSDQSVKQ